MNVVIIGSGNVAEALAKAIQSSEENCLTGIYARNRDRGKLIAEMTYSCYVQYGEALPIADIYIISVSDSAVETVTNELSFPDNAIVAHTTGGITINAINERIKKRAVLYPLQTFTKGRNVDFKQIPLFIEYSDNATGKMLTDFAKTLSDSIYEADSELRGKIHVAAVFACNFTNHMFRIGRDLLTKEGLSFNILKPIIAETCKKAIESDDPAKVQTGPAVRGDMITQEKHLKLIEQDKMKTQLYKLISKEIWETSKKI